jgi:hypothetical protein
MTTKSRFQGSEPSDYTINGRKRGADAPAIQPKTKMEKDYVSKGMIPSECEVVVRENPTCCFCGGPINEYDPHVRMVESMEQLRGDAYDVLYAQELSIRHLNCNIDSKIKEER